MVQQISNIKFHSLLQAISSEAITMSSREIAALTQKRHFDVMPDIERMFEQLGEDLLRGVRKTSYTLITARNTVNIN